MSSSKKSYFLFFNNFRNLRVLNLNNDRISKVEGLNDLMSLREFYLNNNQIIELDGLNL